jgi:Cobalamin synthesis protein cobW C-terminal domain
MEEWQSPFGDRRQQLVYIGQELAKTEMVAALERCLLNDREMRSTPTGWRTSD